MDEDTFNIQTRKFLKKVGVTAQREIEKAVRAAIADGRIEGDERLDAKVVLSLPALGLEVEVEDDIALR
jgi:tellurite resistance protein